MITIRTGELFVEKYNEENGTNLTPKEIFRMLAEKAFKGGRHMVNLTNSKFFQYLKDYNNFLKGKKEEPSFEDALNNFCNDLENRNCGIETTLNVYGGCAEPKKGEMQTTEFNYCDNIHFSVDERYCSFIGSFFQILVGEFATVINNKDIVWLMYKSFNTYYDFIHNNEDIADKQLPTWNGCYFYQEILKPLKHYSNNDFIENSKMETKNGETKISTINFLEYLEALSRLDGIKISNIIFESFGQTNTTCGNITINLEGVKGWFDIFEKIIDNDDEDFDINKYCKIFNKANLLRTCMEYGEVRSNMIEPLFDLKTQMKTNNFNGKDGKKFLKEYLKIIMTEKEQNMAQEFGKFIAENSKTKKSISFKTEKENVLSARNSVTFMNALVEFCNKAKVEYTEGIPFDVVTYFSNDVNKNKLIEFLTFTKFNV